jgi:hypothetical protein
MSLNNIQLPDFLIEEWYSDKLIASSSKSKAPTASAAPTAATPIPAPSATAPTPPAPLKYLGNNRRNITLLVNAPGTAFLPDPQLAFLTKILEACRMTIADVAIVNNAATPATITTVKETLQPKTVLLFGLEPAAIRLPINFPVFKPIDFDACKYLSAPSLDQLVSNTEDSKLLKSKLWVCLKTIFDV